MRLLFVYERWRFGSVGNVVGRINEVSQRLARLVLGWVTVCRRANHLGMYQAIATSHPGKLSLAIHPWVGAVSTSESWGVHRHTTRYTSPPYPWSGSVNWCLAEG